MSVKMELNTRDFNAALKKYMEGSKREVADAVNRVSFDVVRDAVKLTKRSDRSDIKSLPLKPWWPKYVAKRISKKGVGFTTRSKKGDRQVYIQGQFTKAQAKSVSTKIVAGRIKARSFLAAGWLKPVQQLAKTIFGSDAKRRPPGDAKQYGRPKGNAVPAKRKSWTPTCIFANSAMNASRFSSKPNPNPIALKGLQMAFNRKAVDLRSVIVNRLNKLSKKHFKR